MKPAIYYSLHKQYGSYRVVAVTSESKSSWRSGWHGRDITRDNMPTHGRTSELCGRFDTADAAKACIEKIEKIERTRAANREPLYEQIRQIDKQQREEINAVIATATDLTTTATHATG